jgi:tetratricopeptide (TPR) repeat protein
MPSAKEPDLTELLKSSAAKRKESAAAPTPAEKDHLQRKIDGQITEYTEGSGEGIDLDLQDWLAFMLYTNNQLDEAIELYKRLLTSNHRSENQHFYLGNAYFKKGLVKLAVEEWKRVVLLDPESKLGQKAKVRIEQASLER